MGLLDGIRKRKAEQSEQQPEQPKTPLRIYFNNLVAQVDALDMGGAKMPMGINPKQFIPLIAKNISDEMLEKLADFLIIIATDILKIRHENPALENNLLVSETAVAESVKENETIADSTELSEK